ncbi:MAG: tetratricopeptide repeat protein, partial [Desulfobacteraceae bacterium]
QLRHTPFKALKADLIGREVELSTLLSAAQNLKNGVSAIYSICGEAGTGKSRLTSELKTALNTEHFNWIESHAYAYSQNISFAPLINLMSRVFQIEEGVSQKQTRHHVETGIKNLLGENGAHAYYLGRLYPVSDEKSEMVNPELGKSRLVEACQAVLVALAREKPLILCFEDLHWADSSFVELFRLLLSSFPCPVFFLCTYRPPFSLFNGSGPGRAVSNYREIRLESLAAPDAENMVKSLLKTETIPPELERLIHEKAGGNPFYLEEVVNALIDTETLKRRNGNWEFRSSLDLMKIPTKVHGVISTRLDHLEKPAKRVLQEASVIGKSFSRHTLQQITQVRNPIEPYLSELERLDLIRTCISQPGQAEYTFKHSLIQDVVYDGLLIRERQEIHEKIAQAIEKNHADHPGDFYETLAFHFKKGLSQPKAIHYLVKSGEKCLNKYAVGESHQYFAEAFRLLSEKGLQTPGEKRTVIDLLSQWAFVFHFRGDFKGLKDLLSAHEHLAQDLDDPSRLGMFYILFGLIQYESGLIHESYQWLSKALAIGAEIQDQKVIGYASSWLSWTCSELCRFDEAIQCGEKAIRIFQESGSDPFLLFNSLAGIGKAYWFMGAGQKTLEIGAELLAYGQKHSNSRSLALGHFTSGCGHLVNGDIAPGTRSFQEAIAISADPWYSQFSRMLLGFAYQSGGHLAEAQKALEEVMHYGRQFDADIINTPTRALMGLVSIATGYPGRGLKMLHSAQQEHRVKGRKYALVNVEYLIGRLFLLILSGIPGTLSWVKRLKIKVRILPLCALRARGYFKRAARWAEEIGARGIAGQAYLDLGVLYLKKGNTLRAGQYFRQALPIFEENHSKIYLSQAKRFLELIDSTSLKKSDIDLT